MGKAQFWLDSINEVRTGLCMYVRVFEQMAKCTSCEFLFALSVVIESLQAGTVLYLVSYVCTRLMWPTSCTAQCHMSAGDLKSLGQSTETYILLND